MKGPLKVIVFLIIPVSVSILLMSGVFTDKVAPGTTAMESKEIKGVKIEDVTLKNYKVGLTVPGTVISQEEASVSSKIMASISKVMVSKGSMVKEGEPLIMLDPEQVAAQAEQAKTSIEGARAALTSMDESIKLSQVGVDQAKVKVQQAEVQLHNSETTFKRIKSLYENGAVSKQEYDNAETDYLTKKNGLQEAQTALAQAQASLNLIKSKKGEVQAQLSQAHAGYATANVSVQDATIRAPFTGIVVDTLVDVGDMASPGMPVVIMEKAPYYLEAFVDERKQPYIRLNDEMEVSIDALNQTFKGKIVEMTPRVDTASRKFRLKISLPASASVTSGMFGNALIPEGGEDGIYIPSSAIVRWSQFTGVYVVDENSIAHLRYVQLGRTNGDQVEVLSGINEGDKIAVSPVEQIADKTKVVPTS